MRLACISFSLTVSILVWGVHPSWEALLEPAALKPVAEVTSAPAPAASAPVKAQPETSTEAEVDAVELVTITPDDILQGLRVELVEHFGLQGELVLVPLYPLTKVELPVGDWQVCLVDPQPSAFSSRMQLRYCLSDGFERRASESISLQVEWWREAYVARRMVRSDDAIAASAYDVETINWLQHRGDLVATSTPIDTLRIKSSWRPGDPLRWAIAEARPTIESGAVVEVVAEEGSLRVSMRGVATESANAGDLITVRNLASREEIQGIVSDENTVLVVF